MTAVAHLERRGGLRTRRWGLFAISSIMPIATVVMMVFFAVNTSAFLTLNNFIAIIAQNAALIIVTVVFAMLVMAGYVDLSIGSVLALSGVVAGHAFVAIGPWAGVAAGVGVGLLIGVVNGMLIGFFGLSPIVVTLGGMAAARGAALALSPDSLYGFPAAIQEFGSGRLFGIPYIAWVAVVVAAIGIVLMFFTPLGKHIIAIGVNPRASFLVGIRVRRTVLGLFAAVGFVTGIGAVVMVARLDSAPSGTLGIGLEISVLTAVLLGGVPFTGGRGNLWRVLLGVWFLIVLRNGLTLMNVGPEVANIISGSVLVLAAGLEAIRIYLQKRL